MPRFLSLNTLVIFLLCGVVLALSLRGLPGTPDIVTLNSDAWTKGGPLELSPERGRFALLYSIVEEKSLTFSVPVARLATPDLAITEEGVYASLFAPVVSFLAIPGYLFGTMLGASQVGAYAVIALFVLANIFLIRGIAVRLGAEPFAATFAGLTFGFATPAFAYGVNLYQHHVSTFLLLSSLYLLLRFHNIWSLAYVWFACALAVVVDNPNLFLMLPIGAYSLWLMWQVSTVAGKNGRQIRWPHAFLSLLTFLSMIFPIAFFLWYNQAAYGDPFQLPGTLRGVDEIGPDGRPAKENTYEKETGVLSVADENDSGASREKTALGFFETRNLYNGFYIHFLSPDRGILWYAPVVFLGIVGLSLIYRRRHDVTAIILATTGVNILLYSMWDDPWGGWAFGSRYLIPTYALLSLGIAFILSHWKHRLIAVMLFAPLFIFSLWVNSLGALTTSANPPQVEVLALEKQSGHEEKYTFLRNYEYLHEKYQKIGSKAFVYQSGAKRYLSAPEYHMIVFTLLLFIAGLVAVQGVLSRRESFLKSL